VTCIASLAQASLQTLLFYGRGERGCGEDLAKDGGGAKDAYPLVLRVLAVSAAAGRSAQVVMLSPLVVLPALLIS
jgi:hypothetical protein